MTDSRYAHLSGDAARIARMVEAVERDEAHFAVLSTGEKLAVALVLDRHDLMQSERFRYTMLEAVDRLGEAWFAAALAVQKART